MISADKVDKIVIYIFLLIILFLIMSIPYSSYKHHERNKWLQENCKIIGKISSSSSIGFGVSSNGNPTIVPVTIDGKNGYQCNDGMQYWE